MLPKIPVINYTISKPQPNSFIHLYEEFETAGDVVDYVFECLPEVAKDIVTNWQCSDVPANQRESLEDYAWRHVEDYLGENGYRFNKIVKG